MARPSALAEPANNLASYVRCEDSMDKYETLREPRAGSIKVPVVYVLLTCQYFYPF
jgi:hypothetical protein